MCGLHEWVTLFWQGTSFVCYLRILAIIVRLLGCELKGKSKISLEIKSAFDLASQTQGNTVLNKERKAPLSYFHQINSLKEIATFKSQIWLLQKYHFIVGVGPPSLLIVPLFCQLSDS